MKLLLLELPIFELSRDQLVDIDGHSQNPWSALARHVCDEIVELNLLRLMKQRVAKRM